MLMVQGTVPSHLDAVSSLMPSLSTKIKESSRADHSHEAYGRRAQKDNGPPATDHLIDE